MRKLHKSAWLLAALSGGLQVLIFPTPDLHWFCWIALAPLLVAVLRAQESEVLALPESFGRSFVPAGAGQAFLLGWLAGIIWCAGSCYWVFHVMNVYGGLGAAASAALLVLFCLYIGAHLGIFASLLAVSAKGQGRPRINLRRALVLAPFLWVAVELFRTRVIGFPWDLLGTVQVDNIPLSRLATVTGVYGLSFEIVLVNTAFAAAFLTRGNGRKLLAGAAVIAAIALQASEFIHPPALAADLTARLVQQNVPIVEEWSPEHFQHTMFNLRRESLPPGPEESTGQPNADLVVWPESPAPFYANDPLFRSMVSRIATEANAYVIVGTIGTANQSSGVEAEQVFNSASLIGPDGRWLRRYDKIHLVPFGEYVPFNTLLGFAHKLTAEVGDFIPGSSRTVFDLGRYKVGTFICYESIFPNEVRQFAKNGAQVFVNISNDEWFGHSGAPGQHLNQARMRAIENNRWLLRDTNTGITAAIDPYGRLVDRAPRDVLTTLDAPFSVVTRTTFYTRHGDWFGWLCAIISVSILAGLILLRRHSV